VRLWFQRRNSENELPSRHLIEQDGDDLRDLPLIERKRRLAAARQRPRDGVPSSTAAT
jgi:hypothetical protein